MIFDKLSQKHIIYSLNTRIDEKAMFYLFHWLLNVLCTFPEDTTLTCFWLCFRFIHSKNRKGLGYSLAVNHLADKDSSELKLMNGYHYSTGSHGGLPFDESKYDSEAIPKELDWGFFGMYKLVQSHH